MPTLLQNGQLRGCMQHIYGCLRAACYILAVYLLIIPISNAGVSVDGKLELWFEYDGRQAMLANAPTISCIRQGDSTPVKCDLYRSDDGRYWIDRLSPGSYTLRVSAEEESGEYFRAYPFKVEHNTTGPLLVALNRVLQLQEPATSVVPGPRKGNCDPYVNYHVPLLSLASAAHPNFRWSSLSAADGYRYKVWRVRCSDGRRFEPVLMGNTREPVLDVAIPRNEPGEYYLFEVFARHGNQDIAQLLLKDEVGEQIEAFPFVVTDPLGDRSWYPYLLLILLLPFLLWLFLQLLRGVGSVRPGWGTVGLLLVALSVLAGYWQRETLLIWMAQGETWIDKATTLNQRWYRQADQEKAYSEHKPFAGGDWSGYLVARGSEPFYGDARRQEIRILFQAKHATVSLKQDGRWQAVTRSGFSLNRSGSGMTLLGHKRDTNSRELWSISIADINESTLRLVLDRMVTRLDAKGHVDRSIRRQATGELHHNLP